MTNQIEESEITRREVERVIAAAKDALTDEMVGRLATTASDAMELMDQVNRAGLGKAIPALAQLVNNGDVDRLVQLARVYSSAQDALTEEMVSRLAETAGNWILMLDRFSRGGAGRLVEMLEKLEGSGALERIARILPEIAERLELVNGMLKSVEGAAVASAKAPRSSGGIGPIWHLMTDPESQETLRFLLSVGKQLRQSTGTAK